jgi:hypothetical protein
VKLLQFLEGSSPFLLSRMAEEEQSLSVEEKQEVIQSVCHWTCSLPKDAYQPSITWEQIEKHHSQFPCVKDADKYLDSLSSIKIWYNSFKGSTTLLYKVVLPRFWKKGEKRIIYVWYGDRSKIWSLCGCVRKFSFLSYFSSFFCFSLFILFSRKLGLCIHSAVGMISEWGKRNPIEFENRYKKNKDNRKRATSNDIVEHLQASVFNKKRSRAREQAHEYCKKRKLL